MGFGSFKFWNVWFCYICALYHVYLNISNSLEVVLMHKHCPNHFCIFDVKMSIVVLIDKSCKLCSKTVFNPNFYSQKFKKNVFHIFKWEWITCANLILYCTLWLLTFDFDFCLTFFMEFFLCCKWTCLYVSCVPHWYLINFVT